MTSGMELYEVLDIATLIIFENPKHVYLENALEIFI